MTYFPLAGLRKEKHVVFELAWNLIRNRYRGSYFGLIWLVLEPLLALGILYVVFTTIRAGGGPQYAVYMLSGLVIFQVFSRGTQSGLTSLRSNEGIINSLKINKEIFPVSASISSMVVLLIQIVEFLIIAVFLQHSFSLSILLLPIPLLLLCGLIIGLSYFLSIIFVYLKDIQPAWSIFSYALFFVSPIFWHVNNAKGFLLFIYHINPLGRIIEISHNIIFNQHIDLKNLEITTAYVIVILLAGFYIFKKVENNVNQEL